MEHVSGSSYPTNRAFSRAPFTIHIFEEHDVRDEDLFVGFENKTGVDLKFEIEGSNSSMSFTNCKRNISKLIGLF